ncbi:MAG: beta-N-acetylhexosaminidase [Zymomonas mobilis subsp. pomaceae]|uniref:beta-N-acetylhexosaminidase n=1 Tax=Zymomonas mobilis TaxID=542 RepID=UPI0039E7EC56
MKPVFIGIEGPHLTPQEKILFKEVNPAGYILFQRNITNRIQLRNLTDMLHDISGWNIPILIDQEGGRVARMRPPIWPSFPAAGCFDALYQKAPMTAIEAVRANTTALAYLLQDVGINVDCMPLLDIRDPKGHNIIGDRSFSDNPEQVAALGQAALDGLATGGICGVIKHIPGHGQAQVDSHKMLPIVEAPLTILERDIIPFQRLKSAKMAMTAHVIYTEWDKRNCATYSPFVICKIIRQKIGFEGLLMSDDIGMEALEGDAVTRATRVLKAGCDVVLHCSGQYEEMHNILYAIDDISSEASNRLQQATASFKPIDFNFDKPEDKAHFDGLIAKRDALLRVGSI